MAHSLILPMLLGFLHASTNVQGRHSGLPGSQAPPRYIKGTIDYKLHYGPHPHPAAFASFSNGFARSTTEAEFIASESCTQDMAFFRYILEDLGYKIALPQSLGTDNQSAIRVAKNPEHQGCMKHLNPIYYGFREQVEAGEISPHFVPTADMPADILTKALT
jgi:hypothetical protein